jgi:hypothetical protein
MSGTGRKRLDIFDALPERGGREVAREEALRRSALAERGALGDAELVVLADEVFRQLDRADPPR